MRIGRYWKAENFDSTTLDRIEKILTGEFERKHKEPNQRKNNPFGQFILISGTSNLAGMLYRI